MRLTWLRALWALAAFVPLVVLGTPFFADRVGFVVFLLCAMYLWPAARALHQVGIAPFTWQHGAIEALYCAAVGWLVAIAVSRLLRLPAYVERRRAIVLSALVWVPIGLFAVYQVLDYKGVIANETQCPGHMYALEKHCNDISGFREHEFPGFIDRSFVATLRVRPGALPAIVGAMDMKEISPADVPESFWAQPPIWWTIRRQSAAHVYITPRFSFEGRGHDGDHYLLIEQRQTNEVFVYFQNNF